MNGIVIFDLDACVSDDRNRLHLIDHSAKDADAMYERYNDACGEDSTMNTFEFFAAIKGRDVVFITARPEVVRVKTEQWIRANLLLGIAPFTLLMRPENCLWHSPVVKTYLLTIYMAARKIGPEQIDAVYDDRTDVLMAYAALGLPRVFRLDRNGCELVSTKKCAAIEPHASTLYAGFDFSIQEFFRLGMKRDIPALLPSPRGAMAINVGAGKTVINDALNIDWPQWDADMEPLPFGDCSVDVIHAYHFLEHVRDPVAMLREFQRVLTPGGHVNIVVPYYTSQLAAEDLDHKSRFCETTWKTLFQNQFYAKDKAGWNLNIHANFIMGVCERNMSLFTQLQKEKIK